MIKIYTDGAARGNPGPAAAGFIAFKNNKLIKKNSFYLGKTTNNVAEYTAIIKALKWAPKNEKIKIFSDSRLAVKQITKEWKIKKIHLQKLNKKVQKLLEDKKIEFEHVKRENKGIEIVDKLINKKLDKST